jgi:hypothetical protein
VVLFRFVGSTVAFRPMIPVLFVCRGLNVSGIVTFLVDTGAVFSALSEKDAALLRIDSSLLPEAKGKAIGFGGTFKTRMINSPVDLVFESGSGKFKVDYDSGFRVHCIPPSASQDDRELMLRHTPSVLGMDVLVKFEVRVDKRKVELIV